jgi:gliding motility-associated-like protein
MSIHFTFALRYFLLCTLFLVTSWAHGQTPRVGGDTTICSGNVPFVLFAQPQGGVWAGSGLVTPTGIFTAVRNAGVVEVTYTLAGRTARKRITIINGPGANAGKDTLVCHLSPDDVIGTPSRVGLTYKWTRGNGPAIGLDFDTLATPTVTLLNTGTQRYDVVYTLAVTDTVSGCTDVDSVLVAVFPRTTTLATAGPDLRVCAFSPQFELQGSPDGGYWSGVGVTLPNIFTPSPRIVGTHRVSYRLPCSPAQTPLPSRQITVFLPLADAGIDREVCANAPSFQLIGSPVGGTWGGSGVGSSGIFTPVRALVGEQKVFYRVTIDNCEAVDTITITVNDITPVSAGPNLVRCSNDKPFLLTGSTPSTGNLAWSGPGVSGGVFSPAPALAGLNEITFTFTNPDGCISTSTRTLAVNNAPVVDAGRDTAICANARSFNLQNFSPSNGNWSGPGACIQPNGVVTPTGLCTGFQKLIYTVQSALGCAAKDSIQIEFRDFPRGVFAGIDTLVCSNSPAFNLTRGRPAGGRYFGNGVDSLTGRYTPSDTNAGLQRIFYLVRTVQGCAGLDSLEIGIRSLPQINAGEDFKVCALAPKLPIGMLPLRNSSSTRYFYQWSGSDGTLGIDTITKANPSFASTFTGTQIITRSYFLRVTQVDQQISCTQADTIKITVIPKPVARSIPPRIFRGCQGDTITLTAVVQPRLQYQWLNRNANLNPFPAFQNVRYAASITGTYRLIVVDTAQVRGGVCADTSEGDSVYIKQRLIPTITSTNGFCRGKFDTLVVRPNGNRQFTYQWLRDSTLLVSARDSSFLANREGIYQAIIADGRNGVTCFDTSAGIRVDSVPTPYSDLVRNGSDSIFTVCSGSLPIRLAAPIDSANPTAFNYLWSDGTRNRFNVIDTTGQLSVIISNKCGVAYDTLTLSQIIPTPRFSLLKSRATDTTLCQGLPFSLTGPPGVQYFWDGIVGTGTFPINTEIINDSGTVYYLTVIGDGLCSYTDSARVRVSFCTPVVYIPTAFTPQGDGTNELWNLIAYSVDKMQVLIYDRWGEQVYYAATLADALASPWDGTYKGQAQQSGAYQYLITYEGFAPDQVNRLRFKKTGSVSIIR